MCLRGWGVGRHRGGGGRRGEIYTSASSHIVIKSVCLPLASSAAPGENRHPPVANSIDQSGSRQDIRGKMISLGPGEMARRWGGSDGLPPGGVGRKRSTSQYLLMHSCV